ncbi:MAG: TMEM175 family protein [Patescibacteria group bacterium]|mgnify:CR=1 FL=1
MSHSRLDQLSDGIFAIVMTILVFEIRLPELGDTPRNLELWQALKSLLPALLSYILSFALLFTYWRAHHFFVSIYAKNVDLMLTNINALFFMLVSLAPFSASLLGRYHTSQVAVVVFGTHIILIGLTLYWMRRYVLYSDHIKNPEISHHEVTGSTIRTLVPVVFAMVAIALSFKDVNLSLVVFTLAVLFNLSSTSSRMFEKIFRLA